MFNGLPEVHVSCACELPGITRGQYASVKLPEWTPEKSASWRLKRHFTEQARFHGAGCCQSSV